jgi:hypothetical protein
MGKAGISKRESTMQVRSDLQSLATRYIEAAGSKRYDELAHYLAGSVRAIEWLKFRDGRIANVELFFDRQAFAPASAVLAKQTAK